MEVLKKRKILDETFKEKYNNTWIKVKYDRKGRLLADSDKKENLKKNNHIFQR